MKHHRRPLHPARLTFLLTVALGLIVLAMGFMLSQTPAAEAQDNAPTPTFTPFPWAPTPVPLVPRGDDDIINILLLGTDLRSTTEPFRTDTTIIMSVNRTAQTVSLLSIPRDYYVWIPGWNWGKVNTAYWRGDYNKWPGGGFPALAYTIEYNFGVRIDSYALVDFNGFLNVIDTLGGVTIVVDCELASYKLRAYDLDESNDANYDWTVLPVGVHELDGITALWYARSRLGTNDWERNRRQQALLRAIWRRAREVDILPRIPELWNDITQTINTNMTLGDVFGLVPLALTLDESRIESHFLGPDQLRFSSTSGGASILVPRSYDVIRATVENMYSPPTQNVLVQDPPRIEILNGTENADWELVAADRLSWEGLLPFANGPAHSTDFPNTVLYDYTGQTKGSARDVIQQVLKIRAEDVIVAPDPDRTVDYRVILGASYNSCTYNPAAPVPSERE
ncbi:MAG: LCP family protein [Anaerolineae bacterium]|nr:LCP family protein [Anaerolineae bacterium]